VLFHEIALPGAMLIEPEPRHDHRGSFARMWCAREFEQHGLSTRMSQCNLSVSERRGTLRGMHFQQAPYQEAKLVRCQLGSIYDVIVDLRPASPTYKRWFGVELTAANHLMLYVPPGFAHGFQTLQDNTEVFYQVSEFYNHEAERGVRWNDPAVAIVWPISDPILSERDRNFPEYQGGLRPNR